MGYWSNSNSFGVYRKYFILLMFVDVCYEVWWKYEDENYLRKFSFYVNNSNYFLFINCYLGDYIGV